MLLHSFAFKLLSVCVCVCVHVGGGERMWRTLNSILMCLILLISPQLFTGFHLEVGEEDNSFIIKLNNFLYMNLRKYMLWEKVDSFLYVKMGVQPPASHCIIPVYWQVKFSICLTKKYMTLRFKLKIALY